MNWALHIQAARLALNAVPLSRDSGK